MIIYSFRFTVAQGSAQAEHIISIRDAAHQQERAAVRAAKKLQARIGDFEMLKLEISQRSANGERRGFTRTPGRARSRA